jgi:hypothetical protein
MPRPLAHFSIERDAKEAINRPKSRASKNDFFKPYQRDLGRPAPDAKIIRFPEIANHRLFPHVPPRPEGRARRHGRWARDTVDATGVIRRMTPARTAKSRGPDISTPVSSS